MRPKKTCITRSELQQGDELVNDALQVGTLSPDRCYRAEAERAALTATASTAAPQALNRASARAEQAADFTQGGASVVSASVAGTAAETVAQQPDEDSQAAAMAAAGTDTQPEQPQEQVLTDPVPVETVAASQQQQPDPTAGEPVPEAEPVVDSNEGAWDSAAAAEAAAQPGAVQSGSTTLMLGAREAQAQPE